MFCKQCGEQVGEAQRFCSKCGADIYFDTMTEYLPKNYVPPENDNARYAGLGYGRIGGWLLFFVAVNIVGLFVNVVNLVRYGTIELVFSLIGAMDLYEPAVKIGVFLLLAALLLSVVSILLVIIWLVQVFTRNPKFLLVYQIGVIVAFLTNLLSTGATFLTVGSLEPDSVIALVGNIANFFILTYYFCKSVRVRAYMGSDEYKKYAILKFNAYL